MPHIGSLLKTLRRALSSLVYSPTHITPTLHPLLPPSNNFKPTVQKIPGGPNVQVFVGTSILLGGCALPVFAKDTKAGHDLFSQEKPQAIVDSEQELRKDYMDGRIQQKQQ